MIRICSPMPINGVIPAVNPTVPSADDVSNKLFKNENPGGEQQMLAIGRALVAKPKIILFDEPSLGLAPLIVKEVFEAINVIRQEGTTVLLVEQNSKLALNTADRAYVLKNGEIALSGNCQDLLNNEEVKTAYLGAK